MDLIRYFNSFPNYTLPVAQRIHISILDISEFIQQHLLEYCIDNSPVVADSFYISVYIQFFEMPLVVLLLTYD